MVASGSRTKILVHMQERRQELAMFAVNAWRTPKRILHAHPPDQYP